MTILIMYIQFCHIFNVKVIKFDEVDKDTAEDVEENETKYDDEVN